MLPTAVLIVYGLALLIIFIYCLHSFILVMNVRREVNSITIPTTLGYFPPVTIQLPVYNEPYVISRLVEHCCNINYPKELLQIQILDDSTDETTSIARDLVKEYSKRGYNIEFIHRNSREGFKAGALRNGLQNATGEFIAVFDADFIPEREFLHKTLPYFKDKRVALVQTRWEHLNDNFSFLTKIQAIFLDAHFAIEQNVRGQKNLFLSFNGSGGIWRKEAIIDAGNWQSDTLTEDLDLSIRAQLKGWKFVYLNDFCSKAELPVDVQAIKSQQFRWTKGGVETALKLIPVMLKSKVPLLCKIECLFQLTAHSIYPLILLLCVLNFPLLIVKMNYSYLFFNVFNFFGVGLFFTYFYFYRAYSVLNRRRSKVFVLDFLLFLAVTMALSINNTVALLQAVFNIKTEFVRTSKLGDKIFSNQIRSKFWLKNFSWTHVLEIILLVYTLFSFIFAILNNEFLGIFTQILFIFGLIIVLNPRVYEVKLN